MKTNVIYADEFQPDFVVCNFDDDLKCQTSIDMEKFLKWGINAETKTLIIGYNKNLTWWQRHISVAIQLRALPADYNCHFCSSRRKLPHDVLEAQAKKLGF